MNAPQCSRLRQTLWDRREAITAAWYDALRQGHMNYAALGADDVYRRLAALVDQVIALLLAESVDSDRARAIGAAIADLHYLQPTALGRTQQVLAQQLVAGLSPDHVGTLYPRLAALLGDIAIGFHAAARTIVLAEQEQIHGALLAERRRVEQALRVSEADLVEVQRRLVRTREAERLRLARELHDGPVQDLYGARLQLSRVADGVHDADGCAHITALHATLQQVITTLRAMCQDLRPPVLAPLRLDTAIRSHARHVQDTHPEIDVRVELAPDGHELAEPVRVALFRVYQEAIHNVVRHAEARHVVVRLLTDASRVLLEVQDDGRGCIVPQRLTEWVHQDHLGLLGALERAMAINGHLEVVSTPSRGMVVRVIAPLGTDGGARDEHSRRAGRRSPDRARRVSSSAGKGA